MFNTKKTRVSQFKSLGTGRGRVGSNTERTTAVPAKGRSRGKLRTQATTRVIPSNLKPVDTGVMPDISNILGCTREEAGGMGADMSEAEKIKAEEFEKMDFQSRKLLETRGIRMEKSLPRVEVESIKIGLYTEEDIEKLSVVDVTESSELYGRNCVNDPRMGTLKNDKACSTCEKNVASCSGHFGRILLALAIINPIFRKQLAQVLTCICNSCGGLLVTKEAIIKEGIDTLSQDKRLAALALFCLDKPCLAEHAHENFKGTKACVPNPVYNMSKIDDTGILWFTQGKVEDVLPLEGEGGNMGALEILNEISKEELELMGFVGTSHPRNFIMKSLLVIPPCARPPSFRDGYEHPEHLTSMYQDIVRCNTHLKTALKEGKEAESSKYLKTLIFKIEHFIDNTDKMYTQGKGRVYTSIKQRIQGKEALFRGNMVGKRVNFSARTVITGNPDLKFGQIAIPYSMASILTFPETVTPHNYIKLTRLLQEDKVNYIIPGGGDFKGSRLKVNDRLKQRKLEWGDICERHLQNGDKIVANRQPSLSPSSFMAFEVVLWNNLTIGLHLAYTTAFNADFDGDEMNLHAPQSLEVAAEFAALLNVRNCILSVQNNRNIMGVVYDALTGSYLMTFRDDVMIDTNDYYDVLMLLTSIDGSDNHTTLENLNSRLSRYGIAPMSGRGLFSALFPPDFSYRSGKVVIENGVLLSGPITKAHVGPSGGSIIQALIKDYGVIRASEFLTDIYFMMNRWLESVGFSIGLDACTLPRFENKISEATQQKLNEILPFSANTGPKRHPDIEKEIQRAYMLVQNFGTKLDNPLEEERREKQIQGELNRTKGLGVNVSTKLLPENNSLNIMSESGAKGSNFNTAQISTLVGQTYLRGGRPEPNISGGRRTLPFFKDNDITPGARGFIENSFYTGLTVYEMFFHLMGTRENLLDTAIKTADTGNIHHRIGKMLEDLRVYEDGSVRDSKGFIYQYTYGDNGFNPAMLERVTTPSGTFPSFINLQRAVQRINNKYGYSVQTPLQLLPFEHKLVYNGKKAYIIDVGVERLKIQFEYPTDDQETLIIYRKDVDMKTVKATGLVKPRVFFSQPITSLLPVGSRVEINGQIGMISSFAPTRVNVVIEDKYYYINIADIDFDKALKEGINAKIFVQV